MAATDIKKPFAAPPPAPNANSSGESRKLLKLSGRVGFDTLPEQLVEKTLALGISFNILCVGETGIGKSTLMQSLFNMDMDFEPCSAELDTVELRTKEFLLKESNVTLHLSVVETAGFGDQLDKDKSAEKIVDFINAQYEAYLQEELKIQRALTLYHDTRVHACLYFISPTGHGLKALDLVALGELSKRCCVIPVIAKADTTSKQELARFKTKIISELRSHKIDWYKFPVDDEKFAQVNTRLNELIPFAVVGSVDFVTTAGGKKVRARQYPWGVVEVENEQHCDFVKLREALLRTNVEHLRERTHRVHYEAYRADRLTKMGVKDGDTGPNMAHMVEERRRALREELHAKEKQMKDKFTERVVRLEEELKKRENDLESRYGEAARSVKMELQSIEDELQRIEDEKRMIEEKVASQVHKGKKK